MRISSFEGKEVFVCIEGDEDVPGYVHITDSWEKLIAHMRSYNTSLEPDIRVFTGVLSNVAYIPGDLRKCTVFLLVSDPIDQTQGMIKELPVAGAEEIAEIVEEEIENAMVGAQSDYLFNCNIEIDDMFLLYGKQVPTFICADAEAEDEELMHRCKQVYEDVKKLKEQENSTNGN